MSSTHADAFVFWSDADAALQRADIPEDPVTVGARPFCGLVLEHGGVAPIHAAIERRRGGCRVRRLSRVQPVTVNGEPVQVQDLGSGDRLALGDVELLYVDAPAIAPSMLRLKLQRADDEIKVDLPVAGSVTVLGRMEGDILVDDDSVSSRHLEIENFGPGLCWVRDLGSTNGSELNDAPLGALRQPLADGDTITVGRVKIEVSEVGQPPEGLENVVQRTVIFVPDSAHA